MKHADGLEVFVRCRATQEAYEEQKGQTRLGADLSAAHLEQTYGIRVAEGDEYEVVIRFTDSFSAGESEPSPAKLDFPKAEVNAVDISVTVDRQSAWYQLIVTLEELRRVREYTVATFCCVQQDNVYKLAPVCFGQIWASAPENARQLKDQDQYGNILVAVRAGKKENSARSRQWKDLSVFDRLPSYKHSLPSNTLVTWPQFEQGHVAKPVRAHSFSPQRHHHTYQYTFNFVYRLGGLTRTIRPPQQAAHTPRAKPSSHRPPPIATSGIQSSSIHRVNETLRQIAAPSSTRFASAPQTKLILSKAQKEGLIPLVRAISQIDGMQDAWQSIMLSLRDDDPHAQKDYMRTLDIVLKDNTGVHASRAIVLLGLIPHQLRMSKHPRIASDVQGVIEKAVSEWPSDDPLLAYLRYMVTWPSSPIILEYDKAAKAFPRWTGPTLQNNVQEDVQSPEKRSSNPLKRKASKNLLPQRQQPSTTKGPEYATTRPAQVNGTDVGAILPTQEQEVGNKRPKTLEEPHAPSTRGVPEASAANCQNGMQQTIIDLTDTAADPASPSQRHDASPDRASSTFDIAIRSHTSTPAPNALPPSITEPRRRVINGPPTPLSETASTPRFPQFNTTGSDAEDMTDEELTARISLKEKQIRLSTRRLRDEDILKHSIAKIELQIEQARRNDPAGSSSDAVIQLKIEQLQYEQKMSRLHKVKTEDGEEDESDLEREIEIETLRAEQLKRKRPLRNGNTRQN